MKDKLLHTPEGVRDIYNMECKTKLVLQQDLHSELKKFGFQDIQTPSFEFFDIFNHERGTVSSKDMYKFFDREGNTLVLRPDITPSIARCLARYFKDEKLPIRLCYMGNTFINNTSYQGKLKEATQLGAELINDNSVEADVEMLVLTIECLLKAGLKEFQLEIGEVDFLRALVDEVGFNQEEIYKLKELIESKNTFGVENMVEAMDISSELKEIFAKVPELFGKIDVLSAALELTKNDRAVKAIERLKDIYKIMEEYGYQDYISFDLGMLSQYDYYTGIIFKAYTYGTGEAIATGGRYDKLVEQFGKEAPAIGLAIVIDQLLVALSRQDVTSQVGTKDTLILYKDKYRKKAIKLAKHFRDDHVSVVLQLWDKGFNLEEYQAYSKRMGIGGILVMEDDTEIKVVEIETGQTNIANIEDF